MNIPDSPQPLTSAQEARGTVTEITTYGYLQGVCVSLRSPENRGRIRGQGGCWASQLSVLTPGVTELELERLVSLATGAMPCMDAVGCVVDALGDTIWGGGGGESSDSQNSEREETFPGRVQVGLAWVADFTH